MTVDGNMFGTLILDRIMSNMHGRDVITMKNDRLETSNTKIFKKINNPSDIRNSGGHGMVFGLSGGLRDRRLLLRLPTDRGIPKKKKLACDWASSVKTGTPVGVKISIELKMIRGFQQYAVPYGGRHIIESMSESLIVCLSRVLHKLAKYLNCEGKIRPCMS